MTELERLINEDINVLSDTLCCCAYRIVNNGKSCNNDCRQCIFQVSPRLVGKILSNKVMETQKIRLCQKEYRLIHTIYDFYKIFLHDSTVKFRDIKEFMYIKQNGAFKSLNGCYDLTLKEILEKCEVVEDEEE